MNARRYATIAAVALLTFSTAALAQAQSRFQNVRGVLQQVERVVGGQYNPQPYPYPNPNPQPCPEINPVPLPAPGPMPIPAPQPVPASYFLGVYTSTVAVGQAGDAPQSGPQVRVAPGYGQQVYGQQVNSTVSNSPAFHAGLEPGDIIINANGYAMDSDAQLRAAIADSQGYLEMQVIDSRSGQVMWVVAEPESQSPAAMAANPAPGEIDPMAQPLTQPRVLQSNGSHNINSQTPALRPSIGRRPPLGRR